MNEQCRLTNRDFYDVDFYDVRYLDESGHDFYRAQVPAGQPLAGLGDDVLLNGLRYEVLYREFRHNGGVIGVAIKVRPSPRVG